MCMFVAIKYKRALSTTAKQGTIFRRTRHNFWGALATDMSIQTQHPIGCCHYDMQVMTDHNYSVIKTLTDVLDLTVEGTDPGDPTLVLPRQELEHQV